MSTQLCASRLDKIRRLGNISFTEKNWHKYAQARYLENQMLEKAKSERLMIEALTKESRLEGLLVA